MNNNSEVWAEQSFHSSPSLFPRSLLPPKKFLVHLLAPWWTSSASPSSQSMRERYTRARTDASHDRCPASATPMFEVRPLPTLEFLMLWYPRALSVPLSLWHSPEQVLGTRLEWMLPRCVSALVQRIHHGFCRLYLLILRHKKSINSQSGSVSGFILKGFTSWDFSEGTRRVAGCTQRARLGRFFGQRAEMLFPRKLVLGWHGRKRKG